MIGGSVIQFGIIAKRASETAAAPAIMTAHPIATATETDTGGPLLNDVGDVAVGSLDLPGERFTELLPSCYAHDSDQAENDDVFDGG